MTFDEFVKNHLNAGLDYDGVSGVQCVDLVKYYLDECFNIKAGAWGNAHAYYDNFNAHAELVNAFTRIKNTPNLIFKKGDIVVWGISNAHPYGHIAIADGFGDTHYFYSYDQNYGKKECQRIKHNFDGVTGILRPKDTTTLLKKEVNKMWGNAKMLTAQKVYSDSSLTDKIGTVAKNERVLTQATGEGRIHIIYKVTGTKHYKTGFVREGSVKRD